MQKINSKYSIDDGMSHLLEEVGYSSCTGVGGA